MSQMSLRNGLLELGMLLSGCINTISKKAQNNSYARGWHGLDHKFVHPWSQTLIMFLGEALCMAAYLGQRSRSAKADPEAASSSVQRQSTSALFHPIFLVPTFLDLLGTSFGGVGLLYCTASVWQMLRGSIIVFTGVLSYVFLKRKMLPYKWVAITITVCGLVLVGLSGMLASAEPVDHSGSSSSSEEAQAASDSSYWQTAIGISLILAGQLVGAVQMVVEEMFLKNKNFAPLHIVGMEGIYGSLAMAFVILPVLFLVPGDNPSPMHHGSYDNAVDAVIQIAHNYGLAIYCVLYLCSIAFYNFFGLSVTKYLTCVHRTLIDACRTVFVWGWQLLTFYCINERFGEPWTKYSPVQVGGFVLLVCGTLIYNGIVHLPCFEYEAAAACRAPAAPQSDEKEALIKKDEPSVNNNN
eukprot:m51a1_g6402 hypothetical protein (411) ;mRNA; r:232769-234508